METKTDHWLPCQLDATDRAWKWWPIVNAYIEDEFGTGDAYDNLKAMRDAFAKAPAPDTFQAKP